MAGEIPLPALTVPQLSYLVAVAEAPTFAAAAASVGVTTSALSQGLAELERRVGVALFERVGRRQLLRPEAREVLAYAQRVVADTADLARWAHDLRSGRTGRLRVGMIDAAAVHHFPEVLRSFRRTHPDLDLRLTVAPSGELLELLRRGDLDLAVVVEPTPPEPGLDVDLLVEEPLVVVAPEGAERAMGPPSSWGPWVLFPSGSHTRAVIEAELTARGAAVHVVAESHQPEVLREMARVGMGWTVLPEAQVSGGRRPTRAAGGRSTSRRRSTAKGADDAAVLTSRRLVLARRAGRVASPTTDALAAALSER
jgi:DNA-binding transcriptional LysR family regulator